MRLLSGKALSGVLSLLAVLGNDALAQEPVIELKTTRDFVYSNGDDAIQAFVVTIANPGNEDLRDVSFTITMPAGLVLGSVDSECSESESGNQKSLSCEVDFVGPQNLVIIDFFVDGPLSSVPSGQITMELTSDLAISEQTDFEKSLADGDRTVYGSTLSLPFVRDILFDSNNNTIPDLSEQLLQPGPEQSFEQILAQQAVLDVLFLLSSTAETYLQGQLDQRLAQLITATNEVFRDNDVHISIRSAGLENVDFSASEELIDTLAKMQAGSDPAFEDLPDRIENSGADMIVLLHAIPSSTDTFCGFSTNVALGRQGDFVPELHRGQLLSVIDVGPDCIDLPDLAASLATNMGVVPSRDSNPDGGTFSYSAGYGITDSFRTIATRVGGQDFGSAPDVNRFSNPDVLCANLSCGVDENDVARGANALLSLNQTRHLVDALNDSDNNEAVPVKRTFTFSNGLTPAITHTTVETGALIGAFTEFEIAVSNNSSETLHDLNISAFHLNNGFFDLTPGMYRVDGNSCNVSGDSLTTSEEIVDSLLQKQGRLSCYVDSIAPGETRKLSYFIEIGDMPPELDEGRHYLHEVISINGQLQAESARCIPVFTDLVDAQAGSSVCDLVDLLAIATETGSGFLDLEALPTITGNIINVPFLRIAEGGLVSAQFRVVNFGEPELELISYQSLNVNLAPLVESVYHQSTLRLTIRQFELAEATYDVFFNQVHLSDPARFVDMVLLEVTPLSELEE